MQPCDEQALLERAREFDHSALGEIYDEYSPKIYSYMLYRTGDQELAQDLTANVFTKMLDAIQTSNAWQTSFSGWLYRIAHNAVVDHFRRDGRYTSQPLDERLDRVLRVSCQYPGISEKADRSQVLESDPCKSQVEESEPPGAAKRYEDDGAEAGIVEREEEYCELE